MAKSGKVSKNKEDEVVIRDDFPVEEKTEPEKPLPAAQKQSIKVGEQEFKLEPIAVSIKDVPELKEILEDMVANLSISIENSSTFYNTIIS